MNAKYARERGSVNPVARVSCAGQVPSVILGGVTAKRGAHSV